MDELSPIARDALRRYHHAAGLTPPARDRVWRDIEESLACEPPPNVHRLSDRRRNFLAASIFTALAAALVIAVCDVRGRLAGDRRVDAGAAVYEATPVTDAAIEPRAPAANEDPPASTAPLEAPPKPAARPVRPPRPDTSERAADALAAEVALLRQARTALDRGDPDAALRALAGHAQQFPRGQMQEDRLRLHIEALCARGDGERARQEADAFLREHPGSTHAARVRDLCRDAPKP